jgi:PTH1 family peptidyl-tRNA hydrolase
MKIIVVLGNPGDKYEQTRHNIGFLAIDYILRDNKYFTAKPGKDFKSDVFTWQNETEKVIFVKPQTYMNDSGLALKVICNFYKLDFQKDLLVIQDEVDLPFGDLRLTNSASAAGHNGIKSIIAELNTQDFSRLRVGIESRLTKKPICRLRILFYKIFPKSKMKNFKMKFCQKLKQL